jgi:DNA-binding NarL/FixJ family response regulator
VALEGVVGRGNDLACVCTVLDRALSEQPGLVLVVGEAGVGKTTTLRAAVELASERGFVTAIGGCAEGASGTSFGPFRAALRGLTTAYGDRDLADVVGASPAAATLLPAAFRPNGRPDGSPDAGELYDAVLELIGGLASERPLLLALEDLHWADRSTLELLSFLARNLAGERLVLFGTVRSEDVAPDDATGRTLTELARLNVTTRVDLHGLEPSAFRELVSPVGAALGEDEVNALHQRTGGNPFYALELVAAGSTSPGALPPSVTGAIEIRLGTLTENDLAVVRTAAAAGSVDPSLLALVLDCSEQDVESALRAALTAGVLVSEAETGELAFRHALVSEVAYAGLFGSERRRTHRAVANTLERIDGTDAAVLAHHYTAGDRPADALRTSIVAAREAAGTYGSVDAVDHYMCAMRIWNVVPPAGRPASQSLEDLLEEAMLCALNVGAVQQGAELGSRLLETLDPRSDPERWALDAARLAELRWELGDAAGATSLLDRADRYLDGRSDSVARVRVLERRAFQSILSLRRVEGRDLAREALEVARRVGDPEAVVVAMSRVALAATALGEADGKALLVEAFEEAWRTRLPHEMTRAAINLLLLLHTGCRLAETIAAGERVLEASTDLMIGPSHRAAIEALYARALIDTGDWERADDLLARVRLPNAARLRTSVAITIAELATARGDRDLVDRMLTEGQFNLVSVLALRRAALEAQRALADGEPHVARAVVDEMLPLAELMPDASYARLSYFAIRSLQQGDDAAADTYLAAAQARAAAVCEIPAGAPPDQAAWLAAAQAAHAAVTDRPCSNLWHEAAARFGAAGLVVRRAWAQLEEATSIIEEGGSRDEAALLASEAHALALRLGAAPLRRAIEDLVRRARLDVQGIGRLADGDLGLTSREIDVLRLLAAGRTNREIAAELYISTKTASVHVSNILRKVGATTRGEAAAIAHREGLGPTT